MIVRHLEAKNWRNFRGIDVDLRDRQFIVGPNAAGKSNLLDIFGFLRDVASSEGGGLQRAVKQRGGVSKIRSLAARRDPEIGVTIDLAEDADARPAWRYELLFSQEQRGKRQTTIARESVSRAGKQILERPDDQDKKDPERLTQTYLEQINANADFREIAQFLQGVTYLHRPAVAQICRFHSGSRAGK